jgi:hypothetical protein
MEMRKVNLALAWLTMSMQIFNHEDSDRLVDVMLDDASELADSAAERDVAWSDFRAAVDSFRDRTESNADLTAALNVIAATCGRYGLERGIPGEVPSQPNTAEYGRVLACRRIFYPVPDGVVFADGQPFTVEDCLEASEDALQLAGRQDAYEATVASFFALTPGYVCYGSTCWDETDF